MKKLIFTFLLSCLFMTTSIFCQSQKWKFGVTLKTNFSVLDIEDDIYDTNPVYTQTDSNLYSREPVNANRTISGKFGIEGGLRVKYNLFDRFSFISGLEGRFIQFDVSQEVEQKVQEEQQLFTILGSYAIPGNPYGVVQGGVIGRDNNGNPIEAGIESEIFNFNDVNQQLFYLNIPFNIAYTTKSEKMTFMAGFWYSYLLTASIEESTFFPNKTMSYFERNVIGVNAGMDIKINSDVAISVNYSGMSSNFYNKYKTITVTEFSNNMVEFKNKEVRIPASKGFNLLSLGLTYNF